VTSQDREVSAAITEDGIARFRLRIGIPVQLPPPFNSEAHPDTMRHYARGFGDDNPQYGDAGYGARSSWRTVIGAPFYVGTLGRSDAGPMPADIRARTKGALAGVGEFYGGSRWTLHEPVRPGDTVRALQRLIEVSEQSSSTYGRRLVRTRTQVDYTRERDGAPLATHVFTFFKVERSARTGTAAEGTARSGAPAYPADEIDQIEADILAERRRGDVPRYIDDVRPGESLGRLTKGPLRVSDVIAWRIGNGPGTRQWGAFRLLSQVRDKQPGFFTKNDIGAWDLVQRLHWEDAWAQRIGQPRAYDEGAMREAWMAQLATDWMGDAGWVCEIDAEIRKFNYMGDLTRITGEVTEVQSASGLVTVAVAGVNQRGEQTCRARVTVRLPSRAGGGPAVEAG
jgi:acyl dehydratase